MKLQQIEIGTKRVVMERNGVIWVQGDETLLDEIARDLIESGALDDDNDGGSNET